MKTPRVLAAAVAGTAIAAVPLISGPTASAATATATVVATRSGPFGKMLVAGSGPFAGYTLYMITSDTATSFGCTAVIIKSLPGGPGSCTGPSTDKKAEWPAFTASGAVVAGPGAEKALLGTVKRPGVGEQVTYGGHPLYLFDEGPGQVTGIGWDEPSLPPWHGVWWGVSPSGAPAAWPGTLTTTTISGKSVLASLMLTGIGWEPFPVYSFSKDTSSMTACTGSCAVAWPPVLTNGSPGTMNGALRAKVSTLKRPDGTLQLAYDGAPLYLFAEEGIAPQGSTYVATGNGNGVKAQGGTFSLVSP